MSVFNLPLLFLKAPNVPFNTPDFSPISFFSYSALLDDCYSTHRTLRIEFAYRLVWC